MIFIQETKIRELDEKMMQDLRGGGKMLWFGANSEGSRGGLVSVWDPEFFQPTSKVKGKSFVLISGNIKISQQEVSRPSGLPFVLPGVALLVELGIMGSKPKVVGHKLSSAGTSTLIT
ncbi:unnamed protein product [Rhodiola kirilowii]